VLRVPLEDTPFLKWVSLGWFERISLVDMFQIPTKLQLSILVPYLHYYLEPKEPTIAKDFGS
jgi:hypothetical protein